MKRLTLLVAFVAMLVIAAPASAYTLIGTTTVGSADSASVGVIRAGSFVASKTGPATDEDLYVDSGNTATMVRAAIYSDNSGTPGTLLTQGAKGTITTNAWNFMSTPSATLTAGDTYWLAILGTGGQIGYRDASSSSCPTVTSNSTVTSFPSTFPANTAGADQCISVYATAPNQPENLSLPTISGTPQQGDTLTASSGTWSGSPTPTYTYAWSDGATGSTDTLGASDVGKNVSVTVTATNSAGNANATSASVGPVTASSPPPSGEVSMAYWLGWEPTSIGGSIAAGEADLPYASLTRVEMFSAEVSSTSALDLSQNSLTAYNMPSWVAAMHSHGVQAFISIGDNTGSSGSFGDACSSANQAGFISNLVNYATTNGFDGIDWDDEDGSMSTANVAACYSALASAAHAAGLLITSEENQSIPTTDPYSANASDWQSGNGVVDEFYGYNPSNNWNCSNNCAIVTRYDGTVINEGIPASDQILGMATCCSTAQSAYSNLSTTSGTVDTSGSVSSLPLASALSAALPAGNVVLSTGATGESTAAHYEVFSTSGAASGATSIPVTGQVRGNGSFAFPSGADVQSDYAGPWDCYNMAAYAKANGYEGNMDFDLQDNLAFPCLAQIGLGLGLTTSSNSAARHAAKH